MAGDNLNIPKVQISDHALAHVYPAFAVRVLFKLAARQFNCAVAAATCGEKQFSKRCRELSR